MGKLQKNQSGFAVLEAVLILVVVGIVGFTGWYVLNARNNTDKSLTSNTSASPVYKKKSATTADTYAGWQTASVPKGVSFKAPGTYTVTTTDGTDTCTGFTSATIAAPQSLITSSGIGAKDYSLVLTRYGAQSDKCGPDGYTTSGTNGKQDGFDQVTSIVSSPKITTGAISGSYLSFVKYGGLGTGGTAALVTKNQYNNAKAFTDPGTVTVNGSTYQITVLADTGESVQNPQAATIDLSSFKTSDLYKDTINILSSLK